MSILLFFKNKSNVHQLFEKNNNVNQLFHTHRNEPSFCTVCLILKINDRYKLHTEEDEQRKSHISLEATTRAQC